MCNTECGTVMVWRPTFPLFVPALSLCHLLSNGLREYTLSALRSDVAASDFLASK